MKTLYVGNLPNNSTDNDVRRLFSACGPIHDLTLIIDHKTGQKRGFGFINMDDLAAERAISTLNRKQYGGRTLSVSETRAQKWQPPRRARYDTDPNSSS